MYSNNLNIQVSDNYNHEKITEIIYHLQTTNAYGLDFKRVPKNSLLGWQKASQW